MKENELRNIWKRSSEGEEIIINSNKLINDFKGKMEYRERIVRRRDLKEIIGAILGIALYVYALFKLPFSLHSIGAFLVIISFSYCIYKLYNHRKSKYTQNLFLPIKEQLLAQRRFMINQAKLLDTMFYWMFLPFFVSYMIFVWSASNLEAYDNGLIGLLILTKPKAKIAVTLFLVLYGVYVMRLNKRAAKENWSPLIKQIDIILKNLKEGEK